MVGIQMFRDMAMATTQDAGTLDRPRSRQRLARGLGPDSWCVRRKRACALSVRVAHQGFVCWKQ